MTLTDREFAIDFDMLFKIKKQEFSGSLTEASVILEGEVDVGGEIAFNGEFAYYHDTDNSNVDPGTTINNTLILSYCQSDKSSPSAGCDKGNGLISGGSGTKDIFDSELPIGHLILRRRLQMATGGRGH